MGVFGVSQFEGRVDEGTSRIGIASTCRASLMRMVATVKISSLDGNLPCTRSTGRVSTILAGAKACPTLCSTATNLLAPGATAPSRLVSVGPRASIRQLTDVLQCKLQHNLQETGTADEEPP